MSFDGAAAPAVLLSKANLVAPDANWHLRDLQLVGGRSLVTVWSSRDRFQGELTAFVGKTVFVYAIPDTPNETPVLGTQPCDNNLAL